MILGETCKLLQLSGEFPCHVNLQPAPYQSSVAQGTNSALSIPVSWMIKEVSKNGNKKAKVQIRWNYLLVEAIFRHSGMQFFFCFLFSLFPVPTAPPSSLLLPRKQEEREGETERDRERERKWKKKKKRILNMVGNKNHFQKGSQETVSGV